MAGDGVEFGLGWGWEWGMREDWLLMINWFEVGDGDGVG